MRVKRDENGVTAVVLTSNADGTTPVAWYADPATNRALVQATLSGNLGGNSVIADGNKTVTTAGTRVQLAPSTVCKKVNIRAKDSNTDKIFVGGSTVSSSSGVFLLPTESIQLTVNDLSLIYIDSAVNGEGVVFIYEN